MKKILAILLAALMLISFAACGKKPAAPKAEEPETPASDAGVANPWKEVSADEINGCIGYQFGIPENAADIVYLWNETDGIAEMQFKLNDCDYTARAKKTDALEDISGMNYDFSNNEDNYGKGPDIFISNNDQELRGDYYLLEAENEFVNLGVWFYENETDKYSFSLSTVTDSFVDMPQNEVFILGDAKSNPAEYSREFWEAQYPGENICPFTIDENGTEYNYYWVSSLNGWDGTMSSWIKQPFNWNGWHKTADGAIVNKDETLKITDNWAKGEESMSSFCTVTTEAYVPAE